MTLVCGMPEELSKPETNRKQLLDQPAEPCCERAKQNLAKCSKQLYHEAYYEILEDVRSHLIVAEELVSRNDGLRQRLVKGSAG